MSNWEYRTEKERYGLDLNALGQEGWEFVGETAAEDGALIFKRPSLSFREQVTLDQKQRYYALWGIEAEEGEGRAKR